MSDGPTCTQCYFYRTESAPDEPFEFRICRSPLLPRDKVTGRPEVRDAYAVIGTDLCKYTEKRPFLERMANVFVGGDSK